MAGINLGIQTVPEDDDLPEPPPLPKPPPYDPVPTPKAPKRQGYEQTMVEGLRQQLGLLEAINTKLWWVCFALFVPFMLSAAAVLLMIVLMMFGVVVAAGR